MAIDKKMIEKALTQTLKDANIVVINPNELLYAHTKHIEQLEQNFNSLQKLVKDYDKRLDYAEQIARETIAYVESDPYIKERKAAEQARAAAEQAREEAVKLAKFANYTLEYLGKQLVELKKEAAIFKGYEPPESGDLPEEGKKILANAYASCRSDHPDYPKEQCSKIAWGAVHNAGYVKGADGSWRKEK
jgi:hypothetical protein